MFRLALVVTSILLSGIFLFAGALAQQNQLRPLKVISAEGTYAGSYLCDEGEQGVIMTLKSISDTPDDKDMHSVSGLINFFPTVGNPSAPVGAFEVNGTIQFHGDTASDLILQAGKWVQQPENYQASGLRVWMLNGKIFGKPTIADCHSMKMTKIRTVG